MAWQDGLMLTVITVCYGIGNGIAYASGLQQSLWVESGVMTLYQASTINSIFFVFWLVPATLLQTFIHQFNIPVHARFLMAVPFYLVGFITSSFSSQYWVFVIANGVLIPLGTLCLIFSSATALFHFSTDAQYDLFQSVMSSGVGLGIIATSLVFEAIQSRGFQWVERALACSVPFIVLASILMHPRVSKALGIRTKKQKEYTDLIDDSTLPENNDETEILLGSTVVEQQLSSSLTKRMTSLEEWKHLFTNVAFVLGITSWLLASPVFNTVLLQQPSRVISFGYSLSAGSSGALYNGLLQAITRFCTGYLIHLKVCSPGMLSVLAKVSYGVATIASSFFPTLGAQNVYNVVVGICGGMFNCTDYLFIKDCTLEGRELAVTLYYFTEGVITLVLNWAVAKLASAQDGSYTLAFNLMGGMIIFASAVGCCYELKMRRQASKRVHSTGQNKMYQN